MQKILANLRVSATLAGKVADGDWSVQRKPASDKDVPGNARGWMVDRLRGVVSDAPAALTNMSSGNQDLSSSPEQVSSATPEELAAQAEERQACIADQQARVSGFALDLANGGPDAQDDAFGAAA
jgi:methyl-accepting chemotaxis protein